jgi:hypothetical protein
MHNTQRYKKGFLIKNIQFKITLVKNCNILSKTHKFRYINIILAYNI